MRVCRRVVNAICVILSIASLQAVASEPCIFWASDPIKPGQTVVVVGEGLQAVQTLEVCRVPDGPRDDSTRDDRLPDGGWVRVEPIDRAEQALKFVVPAEFSSGTFAYRLRVGDAVTSGLLNRAQLWWVQGSQGTDAAPGEPLHLFGKNLASPAAAASRPAIVRLSGSVVRELPTEGDEFATTACLPNDLPPGAYNVSLHNGAGNALGWSEPVVVQVTMPAVWSGKIFNVRDGGALGDGQADDTAAIQRTLRQADEAGGGVVFLPRGRYRVSDRLRIPRFTVLRGESREWTCLAFTDFAQPPAALLEGTNNFGVEDLTIYAKDHQHVLVGDLGDQPAAGNIRIQRVRVRASVYRGHPTEAEVDRLFRAQQKLSTGGGDTLRLGGKNVVVTDCDLLGSGRSLYIKLGRGGRVEKNQLRNGRWGWYCLEGCDGMVFAHNELSGADLMSAGGCLANYSTTASRNVYFAHNRLSMSHGWDREIVTTDAGDGVYFGGVRATQGTAVTLAKSPEWINRDWRGSGVFILNGKGAGQFRLLKNYQNEQIEIDRPWDVEPDESSELSITMFHGHYLFVDNEFTDCGAMQLYGTSIECVIARNRAVRMQGLRGLGLWYFGYQPSWYCQFLDNEIAEGNYYHWTDARDSVLEVFGAKESPYAGPLNIGSIIRSNHLLGQSHIRVAGTCRDALVEGNCVSHAEKGVFVSQETARVLVAANQFDHVTTPLVDEEAELRAAEAKLARFLGRRDPVAVWDFREQRDGKYPDASGNGFDAVPVGDAARVDQGARTAVRLTGQGYLRVSETAVFNAPELTISMWVRPEAVTGRRGIIGKRIGHVAAPWVLGQSNAQVTFEAATPEGKWPWVGQTPAVLSANTWTHLAVVMNRGQIEMYVNGQTAGQITAEGTRCSNGEPLVIGREAWGGDPPTESSPGMFVGLIGETKIWTRLLSTEEIAAEFKEAPYSE